MILGIGYLAAVIVETMGSTGSTSSQVQRSYAASPVAQEHAAFDVLFLPTAGRFVSTGLVHSWEWIDLARWPPTLDVLHPESQRPLAAALDSEDRSPAINLRIDEGKSG